MKKRKIKFLTTAACLALIGSASAAWVYSGTATASANIGVKVAAYASAGEITVSGADNVYLSLENGSVALKRKDDTKPFSVSYNGPTDTTKYTITREWKAYVSTSLEKYITFPAFGDGHDSTFGSMVFKDYSTLWTEDTDGKDLFEITDGLPQFMWSGLSFEYKDTQGSNLSESSYKSMIGFTGTDAEWEEEKLKEHDLNDSYYYIVFKFKVTITEK